MGEAINSLHILQDISNCKQRYFKRLSYFVDLLVEIFNKILKDLNQPYEH
jgi:hypothetical protein